MVQNTAVLDELGVVRRITASDSLFSWALYSSPCLRITCDPGKKREREKRKKKERKYRQAQETVRPMFYYEKGKLALETVHICTKCIFS